MDFETVLRLVQVDLRAAEEDLRLAETRVIELRAVDLGLRVALERYGLSAHRDETPSDEQQLEQLEPGTQQLAHVRNRLPSVRNDWTLLPIMDAVERAVTKLGRPSTGHEVHDYLMTTGRADTYAQVRSGLAYAGRRARLERVARGTWALPQAAPGVAENAESPADTGLSDGTTGSKGGTDDAYSHDLTRDQLGRLDDNDRPDRAPIVGDS